jgi:hypothetical protein
MDITVIKIEKKKIKIYKYSWKIIYLEVIKNKKKIKINYWLKESIYKIYKININRKEFQLIFLL